MNTASLDSLHDVGIVGLQKAEQDGALNVADEIKKGGVRNAEKSKLYWCTLCSPRGILAKAAAYRHRTKHEGEWKSKTVEELHAKLDAQYGKGMTLHITVLKYRMVFAHEGEPGAYMNPLSYASDLEPT
jgi:hypothetical protein